jgi:signal transduction histidine kinase
MRDSLKHELIIAKNDTSRVLLMVDLAYTYMLKDADSTKWYGNKALALARKIYFDRGEAGALNAIGVGFQVLGEYPKSLEYAYRGLQISEKKNYAFEIAVSNLWIGGTYWFLSDYSKSVDFYRKSKTLFENIINNPGTAEWIGFNIFSIGQAYLEWNQLDSAYSYLLQTYNATLHDEVWHPETLVLLGDCLFRRGNRDTAFDYLRESIAEAALDSDYFAQTEGCAVMSGFFKTMHQPDSAIYYAKKGLTAATSYSYLLGIYENSKLLAEEYEPLNVQEALHYQKIYDSVNEEMYGVKKVQDLQKTLAEEQRRQHQLQEEQIKKENRLKQYGFIAGLAVLLLIAFILYRNNLQKKKANVLLMHQKEKVENTLTELKSTQAQLIQSEKMASLGELTAGIAHEIQNPLNFVNNFSEVNKELIDEASQAIKAGNSNDAINLLSNLKENEEKINFHGQRADAIVKGMLQHSRTSTGQKEPTNINALADEYLRLAYYGFRVKDKSFNSIMKTDFDQNIGSINIVPQDIGRVLLNLYNNAFYAMSEKKKQALDGYEPTVHVTTKKLNGKVVISVKDNGDGIPQKVIDKIFQPFFTTKPAGQGTGLGLSMSYDITKAHGGQLEVHTKEDEYAEFLVELPI